MADLRLFANTSNIIRFILKHSTTGQGLTGLTSGTSGLIISTICDNEATATTYTVAGSTIETISTLGTFAAPTATKCRFKEVDAASHKGLYEFQFADARFAVASSRRIVVSVTGAANLLDTDYEIQLVRFDPYDAARLGLTSLPNAVPGAAGGLFIAGANAATSITTALTANITGNVTGNLSGSVGSVTGAVGSVTGAVGSVTGNVGGNVVGSVASVTGNVAGSVGSVTGAVGSVTAGVTLAASAVQAVWDALTSALTTVGSIGKLLVDNVNATISSRATPSQVNAEVLDVLTVDLIADSYPADGAQPTFAEAVLAIQQFLMEKAVVGTTVTVKKPNGSSSAFTLTLDSATTPTSITRT